MKPDSDCYHITRLYYDRSLPSALQHLFPEHHWYEWKFKALPHHYWKKAIHQRQYFERIAKRLHVNRMEDWYRVRATDVIGLGKHPLEMYDGSLYKALATVYPEEEWLPWKFDTVPLGFWKHKDNHRKYFDWVSKQLNIKSAQDWYKVTRKDIWNLCVIE